MREVIAIKQSLCTPVRFSLRFLHIEIELSLLVDKASPDDPNEISFRKDEILDIVDKEGKWWQARNADGTVGSTSNPPPLLNVHALRLVCFYAFSRTFQLSQDYSSSGGWCVFPCIDHFLVVI
jgi:hypothetical protein